MNDPTKASLEAAKQYGTKFMGDVARWAGEIGKPMVLEEFGMARDAFLDVGNPYHAGLPTTHKDEFYGHLVGEVEKYREKGLCSGFNFWYVSFCVFF